jgi:P-type Ca2+ transporter type 2C
MAVTTVVFAQVFQALAIRSNTESLFRQGLLSNKPLLASAAVVVLLQLVVIYLPALHDLFGTVPLSTLQLAVTALAGSMVLWVVEIEKAFRRRK